MLRAKFGALCEETDVLGVGGNGENRPSRAAESPLDTEGERDMLELALRRSARKPEDISIEFLADRLPSEMTGDSGGLDDL